MSNGALERWSVAPHCGSDAVLASRHEQRCGQCAAPMCGGAVRAWRTIETRCSSLYGTPCLALSFGGGRSTRMDAGSGGIWQANASALHMSVALLGHGARLCGSAVPQFCIRAGRALQPAEQPPADWLRRVWRRCFWCACGWCSVTQSTLGRSVGHSDRF